MAKQKTEKVYDYELFGTELVSLVALEGLSIAKARGILVEKYGDDKIPPCASLGAYYRKCNKEAENLTYEAVDRSHTNVTKQITQNYNAMMLAMRDINATKLLAKTIEQSQQLIDQAITENDVQIRSAKDLASFQANQIKAIDSYANLLMTMQKYEMNQQAMDKGESVSDVDNMKVKSALAKIIKQNAEVIDVIDIPSLRGEE